MISLWVGGKREHANASSWPRSTGSPSRGTTPPRSRRSPSVPGVTKSTFFRHFPDKRELLVAGLERASTAMSPVSRELGPRLKAAVAASAELQERDNLKSVSLTAAMTTALGELRAASASLG